MARDDISATTVEGSVKLLERDEPTAYLVPAICFTMDAIYAIKPLRTREPDQSWPLAWRITISYAVGVAVFVTAALL